MRSTSFLTLALLLVACGTKATNEITPDSGKGAAAAPSDRETVSDNVIPERFHGRFDRNSEACVRPGEYRLVVTAGELRFHESVATVREVRNTGDDAIVVTADFRGEGDSWRERRTLRLAGNEGLTVESEDGAQATRIRCDSNPPSASPPSNWELASAGEGNSLMFSAAGERRLTLSCPAGSADLLVNVPSFTPIASEDRMSLGSGGTVVALVADPQGDRTRGGVTGRGPIPAELPDIVGGAGGIGVNYGFQNSGPHESPPPDLASAFLAGCRNGR